MKAKVDKDSIVNNLKKLEGTETDFRKISITEDFTEDEQKKTKKLE